jgi:hypothetical protein
MTTIETGRGGNGETQETQGMGSIRYQFGLVAEVQDGYGSTMADWLTACFLSAWVNGETHGQNPQHGENGERELVRKDGKNPCAPSQ